MTLPKIGILFPSKNDESFIGFTLVALIQEIHAYMDLGGKVELRCINDGSTDGTAGAMERHLYSCRAPYQFINRTENIGVTRSLEEGFATLPTDCEAILRCDADAAFFTQGWMFTLASFLFSDKRIGVVAPLVLKPRGYIDNFGVNFFPSGETFNELGIHFQPEKHSAIREVDTTLGIYAMMRYEDWTLDTGYRLWVEDEDQGLTLRQRGKKNFTVGYTPVIHYQDHRPGRTDIPRDETGDFRNAHPIRRESLEYFEKKWGFSPLQPDLTGVRARYAKTELLWFEDATRQQAGSEIISKFEREFSARHKTPPPFSLSFLRHWIEKQKADLAEREHALDQRLQDHERRVAEQQHQFHDLSLQSQKQALMIERLKQKLESRVS